MRLPLLYSDDQILYYNGYRPSLPDTILQRLPLVAPTAARLTPLTTGRDGDRPRNPLFRRLPIRRHADDMPELREVQDMMRRARTILPPDGNEAKVYKLRFHLEHARGANPKNLPLIGIHILQTLPDHLRLTQSSIQAHGKSLIIIIQPPVTILRVQFYLHGHMLVISEQEMQEIEQYWARRVQEMQEIEQYRARRAPRMVSSVPCAFRLLDLLICFLVAI